ncbi:hypothetical protein RhiirA1_445163 [Rhizophagus irregularis]|uniref:Uncharacterized protein n=1 Tax=Rhizophagus irregularis TaxID=588596 RepID=A0A2N0R9K9_9GLOM|nr:hypothetical protein RhiirA1_445163 [Rhizophagus irregularis]
MQSLHNKILYFYCTSQNQKFWSYDFWLNSAKVSTPVLGTGFGFGSWALDRRVSNILLETYLLKIIYFFFFFYFVPVLALVLERRIGFGSGSLASDRQLIIMGVINKSYDYFR